MKDIPEYSEDKLLSDLNFLIIADVFSHHVNFTIYEVITLEKDGSPLFQDPKEKISGIFVNTIEQAEPYVHGYIKWDGCSNWYFDEQDKCMLHGCSREDLDRFGKVLVACWDWMSDLCSHWSP
jgi:hypothetical protein